MMEETLLIVNDMVVPGRFLVDTVPWLKYVPNWVPGASFQVVARETKAKLKTMASTPFQQVKRAMVRYSKFPNHIYIFNWIHALQVDGTASPSFTVNRLQDIDLHGDVAYQESLIEDAASVMFAGTPDMNLSGERVILSRINHRVSWS